ncbi:PTS transporter subunit EIIC [Cytobacillus sp.]|uniref:PTS transporter subunit EIIC n=1 Tax=Cytobacillus sp. TaxID=2675269 RepID=UPI0035174FAB
MSNFNENVSSIIENIGGAENVVTATHCVTRLRLVLNSEELVNVKKLEENDLVKGTFSASGQFQVIIGPGLVEKVFAEFVKQTGTEEVSTEELREITSKKKNVLQRGIRVLADIFIPILPAIVAAGLLMGLNNVLANPGIFYEGKSVLDVHTEWSGFAGIINLISNTAFTFLPALIAFSAAKKFGGNPVLGIVLGLIMVHPELMNAYAFASDPESVENWNLFGFEIAKVGYQGQVIPVLFAAYLLAALEISLRKVIPESLQLLAVAPIALIITGIATFTIIGPVTMAGANWITDGILYLFDVSPVLAGAVYGLISPPLVITGMHHLFLGVNLQMAGSLGYVTLWPIGETVTLAQGIAALTMFFLIKNNKKLKSVSLSATVSAWLGITEPAIYGVNLRFRYPFIAVMIGSAIGSAYLSFMDVKATSVGVGGMLSFLSVFPEYWGSYFTGMAITAVITVGLTLLFSKGKMFKSKEVKAEVTEAA